MKKIVFILLVAASFYGCKPTTFIGDYGQVNQTQVVLSEANFIVLGSFTGTAIEKKNQISIKGDQEGLVAKAKADLIANAKASGVELTGSRTLINVSLDMKYNTKHITATVSGEIVEFVD